MKKLSTRKQKKKEMWKKYKLASVDLTIEYRVEPGCFVTRFLGVELRFENFIKMENFFREYIEAIHFNNGISK